VFSGIQPTGTLHLGNYLGAVRNWVDILDRGRADATQGEVLLSVVDLHAITVPQEPAVLRDASLEMMAQLIACGVDPDRAVLFIQSHVREHTELAWLLTCHTPLGWLNHMTQFKEKAKNATPSSSSSSSSSSSPSSSAKGGVSAGLFMYPVLQAADILLYNARYVPVGEDQRQHIELSRDIAQGFNNRYGCEAFVVPEVLINTQNPRVMSLRDGTKKMSKSDLSDMSRINLTDEADTIALKIKRAKSDGAPGVLLPYDEEGRPEMANLARVYAAVTGQSLEGACAEAESACGGSKGAFKALLADALVAHLAPIRARYLELVQDKAYLARVADQNAAKASERATVVLDSVKRHIGIV
jgi:tryptophanyl-tRNA synthetase